MYIIFLLLYCIGDYIQVNLVGSLSISDIIICLYIIYFVLTNKFGYLEDKAIRYVTKLYLLLLLSQIVSEILVENILVNSMKGLAVTILSYVKFIFLWLCLNKRKECIFWIFLWNSIIALFFIEDVSSIEAIASGEELTVFKFRIAPLIGQILVLLSFLHFQRRLYILFIFMGLFCIVLGARSEGLIIFLTGIVTLIIRVNKSISRKFFIKWGVFLSIIMYGLFLLYVDSVLSGDIIGGNSSTQIKKAYNPYNPIYVLLSGRKEAPASLSAISDSPLIGFGAWAEDPNYKYRKILYEFQKEKFDPNKVKINIIPAHSVIFQTGVNNGIMAMFMIVLLLYTFIKKGIKSLKNTNCYLYLIAYIVLQIIWHGLFSPLGHMKGLFPFYFACCLFSFTYTKNIDEKKYISSNSYIRR